MNVNKIPGKQRRKLGQESTPLILGEGGMLGFVVSLGVTTGLSCLSTKNEPIFLVMDFLLSFSELGLDSATTPTLPCLFSNNAFL